jgi:hypothetical protein
VNATMQIMSGYRLGLRDSSNEGLERKTLLRLWGCRHTLPPLLIGSRMGQTAGLFQAISNCEPPSQQEGQLTSTAPRGNNCRHGY